MEEGYPIDLDGPDHGEPTTMIGMPAALAAVLIIGGLLAIAVINFVTPSITRGLKHTEDRSLDKENAANVTGGDVKIAPFFTPQVQRWEPQIRVWAKKWNLDANLVATVMQIESCGDQDAVSRSGALGLFQVMPYHFQSGEEALDPEINAQRGIAYLRQAFDARQGDIHATFASYNGGINGASLPESLWPEETRRYARWGVGIYGDAQTVNQNSSTLDAWIEAGGASLCAQAGQHLASIDE